MSQHHSVDLTRERVTREVAREILTEARSTTPPAAIQFASDRIRRLVESEIGAERERCVGLCRERAELWRAAADGRAATPEESRGRANEAAYLADLLETGMPFRVGDAR